MPGFLSPGKGMPLHLIPEYSGINKGQWVPDRSKTAHRKPGVKCFLTLSNSLWPNGLQHDRPPCPSLMPRVYPNSCPLSWWCHTSNHPIICRPLLLLPSIFPRIRVFSNDSVLPIRWTKYWSFHFSISSSNEHSGLISLGWTGWITLLSKGLSTVSSSTTVRKHQFFDAQLSL